MRLLHWYNKKRLTIIQVIIILIIAFHWSTTTKAEKNNLDFAEGDLFLFSSESTTNYNNTIDQSHLQTFHQTKIEETLITINSIDLETGELNYSTWYHFAEYFEGKYQYSKVFNTSITEESPLFKVSFAKKTDSNKIILTGIYLNYFFYFLEPNWAIINANIQRSILNTSYIIYSDWRNNFSVTAGEFYASCESFSFLGEKDLLEAAEGITPDTHAWWGTFIINNQIHYKKWSEPVEQRIYYSYDQYQWSFYIEFTRGGRLVRARFSEQYSMGNTKRKESLDIQHKQENGSTETNKSIQTTEFGISTLSIGVIILCKKFSRGSITTRLKKSTKRGNG